MSVRVIMISGWPSAMAKDSSQEIVSRGNTALLCWQEYAVEVEEARSSKERCESHAFPILIAKAALSLHTHDRLDLTRLSHDSNSKNMQVLDKVQVNNVRTSLLLLLS